MAMLDHSAYPGIIDLIIQVAPFPSLLALRRTSKSFRDLVDRRLLTHVELQYHDGGELSLRTVGGTHHRLPFKPELVHIADQVSETPYPRQPHPYAAFTQLRTLRRHGDAIAADDAGLFPQVDTLVDFIHLARYRQRDRYNVYSDYEGSEADAAREDFMPGVYPNVCAGPRDYPPSLRRYVLHVHHDKGVWELPSGFHQVLYNVLTRRARKRLAPPVREVVVVLHRSVAHPIAGRRLANALETAMDALLVTYAAPESAFTLVGFNTGPAASSAVRTRPTTRCLTMEEWLDTLGDRREVEGLWAGPPVY